MGWNVMVRQEATNENGDSIYTNLTGVICPWTEKQERYFWVIEFDRQVDPDSNVDIEELAEIINYTYRSQYPFIRGFRHHIFCKNPLQKMRQTMRRKITAKL